MNSRRKKKTPAGRKARIANDNDRAAALTLSGPPIQKLAFDVLGESRTWDTPNMPLSNEEQQTLTFLKTAAVELRRIADEAPEMSDRLLLIVQQLENETAGMERRAPAHK